MKLMLVLLNKELTIAFRSRQMVWLGLSLALAFSVALSFPLASEQASPKVASVVMWMILFFSSSDQSFKTFLREEERGTADQLRLRVPSSLVFLSKVASNSIMLMLIGLASSILLCLWLKVDYSRFVAVVSSVTLGSAGLALSQGAVGFLLGFGKGSGAFYPLVAMPVVLPVAVSLILITSACIEGVAIPSNLLIVVAAQSLAVLVAGLTLLPYVEV